MLEIRNTAVGPEEQPCDTMDSLQIPATVFRPIHNPKSPGPNAAAVSQFSVLNPQP